MNSKRVMVDYSDKAETTDKKRTLSLDNRHSHMGS